MDQDPLRDLLLDFCQAVGMADAEAVVARRTVYVAGMDVSFETLEDDEEHFHVHFRFGAIAAGRALRVLRLMLEANLLVYAGDNGRFALDADTGESVLMLRVKFSGTGGAWLAETLTHYAGHGMYWRENILDCPDDQFNGIATREYQWIRV